MQAAAAVVNQAWINFGGYVAGSFRRIGILSAVRGQSAGGIVDADALDRVRIEAILLTDVSPGLRDELYDLNNVPVDGDFPMPIRLTAAQQHTRELSRHVRVSDDA